MPRHGYGWPVPRTEFLKDMAALVGGQGAGNNGAGRMAIVWKILKKFLVGYWRHLKYVGYYGLIRPSNTGIYGCLS